MTSVSPRCTALERAFTLAAEGRYSSAAEIKRQLVSEGFTTEQITGPTLLRQIRALCISARKKKP
jgi:hypothetical protein